MDTIMLGEIIKFVVIFALVMAVTFIIVKSVTYYFYGVLVEAVHDRGRIVKGGQSQAAAQTPFQLHTVKELPVYGVFISTAFAI